MILNPLFSCMKMGNLWCQLIQEIKSISNVPISTDKEEG